MSDQIITSLIEKLEGAEVGSRELDCAIWTATGGWDHVGRPPTFSTSIDAALALADRVLRRHGLSRIKDLEPPEPVRRYERAQPGELIHIDIKKLGRFARVGHRITGDRTGQSSSRGIGWEYLHLAVDDHSRLAYSEIHPDEQRGSCLAFLVNALRFFFLKILSHSRRYLGPLTGRGREPLPFIKRTVKRLKLLNPC